MRVTLVKIGNSQGIRIPKAIIEQVGLGQEIDLQVSGKRIILRPVKRLRSNWETAAKSCHETGEDDLAEWDTVSNDFEGQWE